MADLYPGNQSGCCCSWRRPAHAAHGRTDAPLFVFPALPHLSTINLCTNCVGASTDPRSHHLNRRVLDYKVHGCAFDTRAAHSASRPSFRSRCSSPRLSLPPNPQHSRDETVCADPDVSLSPARKSRLGVSSGYMPPLDSFLLLDIMSWTLRAPSFHPSHRLTKPKANERHAI